MLKKFLITIVVLIALVGGLAAMKISQFKTMGEAAKSAVQPPEAVTSMEVREEKWQPTLTAVGSLAAYQGVTLTTEAAGIVSEIAFEAGSRVRAGDLLVLPPGVPYTCGGPRGAAAVRPGPGRTGEPECRPCSRPFRPQYDLQGRTGFHGSAIQAGPGRCERDQSGD